MTTIFVYWRRTLQKLETYWNWISQNMSNISKYAKVWRLPGEYVLDFDKPTLLRKLTV